MLDILLCKEYVLKDRFFFKGVNSLMGGRVVIFFVWGEDYGRGMDNIVGVFLGTFYLEGVYRSGMIIRKVMFGLNFRG